MMGYTVEARRYCSEKEKKYYKRKNMNVQEICLLVLDFGENIISRDIVAGELKNAKSVDEVIISC